MQTETRTRELPTIEPSQEAGRGYEHECANCGGYHNDQEGMCSGKIAFGMAWWNCSCGNTLVAKVLSLILAFWVVGCGADEGALSKATEIAARGPAGERGPMGPQGEKGEKGDPGEDGETVVNEVEPTLPDTWEDPVTGRVWTIGPEINATNVLASCTAGYEVPDINDFNEAYNNGLADLMEEIGGPTYMWLKNLSDGLVQSYRDLHDGSNTNTLVGGSLFCVEI